MPYGVEARVCLWPIAAVLHGHPSRPLWQESRPLSLSPIARHAATKRTWRAHT